MSSADLKALQKDNAYNRNLEIIFMVVGAILLLAPMFAGPYARIIGRSVITYMILAVSWDMLVRSGQLSFGIAGFFGLGGYAATVLAANYNIPGIAAIILGALLSGVVAYGLGLIILRLRGMYFAITTLALAEIFRIIMHNWTPVTGGPNGKLVPQVLFAGNSYLQYGFMVVMAVLVIALSEYMRRSKIHYALTAIHDNEVVAKSNGINIYKNLLFIFAVVSAIQALAGGGYAHLFGFVSPESNFNANYTLIPLAIALFGGMYSTWGPVVGAVILGVMGEFLKLYIPYGHLVVYGIIIILVLLFMPQGVVGIFKAKLFKNTSNYPSKEELELSETKGEPA
ncbi:branched-chain amino acid ABC transporter permease [Salinispira pacifica]|uniref:Branched-chain amino acid transport system permease protein LivM n=1 Tax=Salinispira pacifica TaxID=1307761 RepID=V5WJJ8_9SPIO|nr:branched-chain amino acid ABC transporter permease [Salinispira pacifica]AHC15341.1 Branched-chain amino acid transport system permease protein LivM [Salinispira pacifica]